MQSFKQRNDKTWCDITIQNYPKSKTIFNLLSRKASSYVEHFSCRVKEPLKANPNTLFKKLLTALWQQTQTHYSRNYWQHCDSKPKHIIQEIIDSIVKSYCNITAAPGYIIQLCLLESQHNLKPSKCCFTMFAGHIRGGDGSRQVTEQMLSKTYQARSQNNVSCGQLKGVSGASGAEHFLRGEACTMSRTPEGRHLGSPCLPPPYVQKYEELSRMAGYHTWL